jgi:hypothetical protein
MSVKKIQLETKIILSAVILAIGSDEIIHCVLDNMYVTCPHER